MISDSNTINTIYAGLSSVADGDVWMYQGGGNRVNGISNYQNMILAYEMPLILSRIGIVGELNGYYKDSAYTYSSREWLFNKIALSWIHSF